jgi:prepilin-type N-terminal cleavage/methylation domain-containing protein
MLSNITSAIRYPKVVIVRRDRAIQGLVKKPDSVLRLDRGIESWNDNRNNKGMSLVEVMIALLVLLFVSLALMQTALVSIESNMKNTLRDVATSIAEARIAETRGTVGAAADFDALAPDSVADANLTAANCGATFVSLSGGKGVYVTRNLTNSQGFGFCTYEDVPTGLGASDKAVTVTVAWLWKGEEYSHTSSTVLMRPSS